MRKYYGKILLDRAADCDEMRKDGDDFWLWKMVNNKKACKLKSGKGVSSMEITGRNDLAGLRLTCLKS